MHNRKEVICMPNWTTNTVTMTNIANEDLYSLDGKGDKYFDFNKLIPEPETKEECIEKYGEEFIDNGDKPITHNDGKEWFDWYEWRYRYWGVKWNSCRTFIDGDDCVIFDTPWGSPRLIFEALSKRFPDREINVLAEYEDGYVYDMVYLNGECIELDELDMTEG